MSKFKNTMIFYSNFPSLIERFIQRYCILFRFYFKKYDYIRLYKSMII